MTGVWPVVVSLTALLLPAATRGAPMPTRTVLAFDNSGSMRANDPHRLAQAAAMLYVQLAKKGDQVGLVVFDERAWSAVPLGSPARLLERFSRKLARLRLDGATTDLGQALERALRALGPPKQGVRDVVVLLTDGHVDLGTARKAEVPAELARIRGDVVRRYRARGAALYTIAFTPQADRALMDDLARGTNGAFRYIPGANELHRAFYDLFAVASSASSLPVQDGSVMVDGAIKQTSLVMSKTGPDDQNTVVAPDEEVLDAKSRRKGVKWKSSRSYDLVELDKPDPGAWQMRDKDGQAAEGVAIIQDSGLDLDVVYGPKDATVNDELRFAAQLLENGKRVGNFARLKSMTVEAVIEGPDRKRRTILFEAGSEAGEFVARIRNSAVGHYGIRVVAVSPALQREWRGSYAVRQACFQYKVRQDAEAAAVLARQAPDCPPYTETAVRVARHLDGTEPEWITMNPGKNGVYIQKLAALAPGQKGVIRLRFTAQSQDGYPILVEPEPIKMTEPPPTAWMNVIGLRLVLINIPLILLGSLGYAVYRARQKATEVYDD